MDIRKIQEADVENKKVILRVDFNVSMEDGHVKESFKIEAVKDSLDYLLKKNAKVALMSYFGRPGGKKDAEFSMEQLVADTQKILGVRINFVSDCIGEKVLGGLNQMKNGEVLMLENVRFYPEEEALVEIESASKNSSIGKMGMADYENFSKQLAEHFDIFVNDAFSQSHRDQASVTGITKFIPSYAGFRLQKEVEEMEKIKNNFLLVS